MDDTEFPNRDPLLSVENLTVTFYIGRRTKIHAVSGVCFNIRTGETLGLVGESGCGKSTVARSIVRLQKPTAGRIIFDGFDLSGCTKAQLRTLRPDLQMIFQDAVSSLNPGRRILHTIAEPLRAAGKENNSGRLEQARKMMRTVGMDPDRMAHRYPFELSGGQCQRVSVARALILKPRLIVCDEPVSSLDVSVQAQILNLLEDMKQRFDLTLLFISHDLAVVKNISDRVAVMYLGKLCEIADAESLYRSPHHPYTNALLSAIPEPDPNQPLNNANLAHSEMPSPATPPPGCRFHTRCPEANQICTETEPHLSEVNPKHQVACHFPI